MSGSIPLRFNSYNYLMKLQLLTPLMTLYSMTRIYSTKMRLTTTSLKTSSNQKTPPKSILQKPIKPKQLIPPKTQKTLKMKIHNRKTKNLNMKPIPQQLKTNTELPPDTASQQEEETPHTQQSEAQAPPEIPNTSLLSVEDVTQHLTIDAKTNIPYIPLSATLTLKRKRHMFYFPMDFENLTLDGIVDTGALTSAISEADLYKI